MGDAFFLHNCLYIGKVQVDNSGHINQVGNSLYCLLEDFIRFLKGLGHCSPAVHNFKKLVIGYHNKRVHAVLQAFDTAQRVGHTCPRFKTEGLCHNAYRKDSHSFGNPGNYRRRAGSCPAAHTAGYEYHVRTGKGIGDFIRAFFSRLLANLRLCAGAQSLGQLLSDLEQLGRLA